VILVVSGAPDESNELVAHAHPSQTAMAISPTSASDIRYAVIGALSLDKMCGIIAIGDHFGREPYPHTGAACGRGPSFHAARRHFRACRPITLTTEHDPEKSVPVSPRDKRKAFARRSCSNENKGLGRRHAATPVRRALGDVASLFAAAVRFGNSIKNPRRIPPRGFCNFCDDGVLPLICPTCQSISEAFKN
jgi:hypothetical protein